MSTLETPIIRVASVDPTIISLHHRALGYLYFNDCGHWCMSQFTTRCCHCDGARPESWCRVCVTP